MTVIEKIKELTGTTMSADLLQAYIDLFDDAAPCLSSYPQSVQDLSMALAVSHMITMSSGQLVSESSPTGASASYAFTQGKGMLATGFGQQLAGLPTSRCFLSALSTGEQFAYSVGRR